MKILHPLNLTKNELLNAVIQNLAQAPASPKAGQIYFDTGENDLKIYNGTAWVSALAPGTSINGRTGAVQLNGGNVISINEDPNGTFTFNHDTISNTDLTAQARRYVTGLTFDDYGHITGYTTGTETVTNTDTVTRLQSGTGGTLVSGDITIAAGTNVTVTQGGTGSRTLTIASSDTTYGMMTSTVLGLGRLATDTVQTVAAQSASSTASRTYGIQRNSDNQLVVNVPWVNTNTTYTAGTYLTLNGTQFNHDATERVDDTDTAAPSFGGTFTAISEIETNATGHVTEAVVKTITLPSETTLSLGTATGTGNVVTGISVNGHQITLAKDITALTSHQSIKVLDTTNTTAQTTNSNEAIAGSGTINLHRIAKTGNYSHLIGVATLSLVDNGTGTWMTGIAVDDHEITVSRSNSTTDTITVGELIVSNSGAGNGDVTIAGNLTVNGTTTTISTETVEIEDNLILINKVDASQEPYTPPTNLVGGLQIYRGTETDYKFVFVEEFEDFRIGEVGDLQPVLTRDETDNFADEDLLIWDDANNRAVGAKPADLDIPRKYAVTQAIATNQNYTITHNLGTTDVTVSLKDNTTNEFLYAGVETLNNNQIRISFGEINSVSNVRVVVIG